MKMPVTRKVAVAITTMSVMFAMVAEPAAYAAVAPATAAGSTGDKLTQLEMRFFEHPYTNESEADRLNRLENFVFGQTRTGTDQQRLDSLVLVMPPAKLALQKAQPQPDTTAHKPDTTAYKPDTTAYKPDTTPYKSEGAPGGLEPTVTALENHVLGTTHKGQSIASRLNTLEEAVFSADADHNGSFAERIGRLKMAVGEESVANQAPVQPPQPPQGYQQGYTSASRTQPLPPVAKTSNGHPVLKKAAEAAVIVGAVAGVAALTIMATKGMGGMGGIGAKRGLFRHLDLD